MMTRWEEVTMSGETKSRKKNKKDSQLIIRISKAERDRFTSLCDAMETRASREIRRFVCDFLEEHEGLCCANSVTRTLPLSPDGLIPRAP